MLNGMNAVVTGAKGGIGKSIVERFLQKKANVWACIRQPDPEYESWLDSLAQLYGRCAWPVYFDATNKAEMKEGVRSILSQKRPVDILVNNMGAVAKSTSFLMTPMDKMKEIFEINFFAQMELTQYISRNMMRNKQGSIIMISSVAAIDGTPGQLEYVSSKAALIGATRNLAIELGDYGIRVNAIAPGVIDTSMGRCIEEKLLEKTLNKSVMARLGRTDEVASLAAFLASKESSYMTGQIVRIDGGM